MTGREEYGVGPKSRRTVVTHVRMLVTSAEVGGSECSVIVDGDDTSVLLALNSTGATTVRMTHEQAARLEAGIAKARRAA